MPWILGVRVFSPAIFPWLQSCLSLRRPRLVALMMVTTSSMLFPRVCQRKSLYVAQTTLSTKQSPSVSLSLNVAYIEVQQGTAKLNKQHGILGHLPSYLLTQTNGATRTCRGYSYLLPRLGSSWDPELSRPLENFVCSTCAQTGLRTLFRPCTYDARRREAEGRGMSNDEQTSTAIM